MPTLNAETPLKSATSKRDEVEAFLRREAQVAGRGNKLPTVRALCRTLGVSKSTVNSALEELQDMGILWRKQGSGIYVSDQVDKKCIALVFGENVFEFGQSPFYSMLLDHSRQRAASHDEKFSFYLDTLSADEGQPAHHDLVDALERRRLHGVLLVSRRSAEQVAWMHAQGVPVVSMTIGCFTEPNCVEPDYAELIRMGTRTLAGQGCQRIGLISSLGLSTEARLQNAAHREALAECGLPLREEWIWEQPGAGPSAPITAEEQGYWALMKLLETDRHALDGVVITDDMMTRGALVAAQKLGLTIGSDLKIATHANKGSALLREQEPAINLLEIDPVEIVEAMFGMLERLMAGNELSAQSVLIPPKLRAASQAPIS